MDGNRSERAGLQKLPLADKLWLAQDRIRDWYEYHNGAAGTSGYSIGVKAE